MATQNTTEITEVKITTEEALDLYLNLKAQIDDLSKKADALKAQLREATSAAPDRKLILNGHKLTLRTQSKTSISFNEVLKVHPRLAKKFGKTTTYEVFDIR